MKGIVIYASKYGNTKEYATYIGNQLGYKVCEVKNATKTMLIEHDVIIYGGGLYAGGINGIKFLKKNFSLVQNKPCAIFTCGLADPTKEKSIEVIRKGMSRTIDEAILNHCKIVHVRGGINYDKMSFVDKQMMKMFYKIIKKKMDTLSEEEKLSAGEYGKNVEYVNVADIKPLIQWANEQDKQ